MRRRGLTNAVSGIKLFGVAVAAAAVVAASLAVADDVDVSSPSIIVVGAPMGAAPSDRLGPSRQGFSSLPLPSQPIEQWRRSLAGGLDFLPLSFYRGIFS